MEQLTLMNNITHKYENNYKNHLFSPSPNPNTQQSFMAALKDACYASTPTDQFDQFFKEIGLDKKAWGKLESGQERLNLVLATLQKSVEEGKKKVGLQIDNYLSKKSAPVCLKSEGVKDSFEWLKLKNKYPMCEPKLKAKLVQAISDNNNQNRIRQRIADPEKHEKVHLMDESLILDEYEKMKIDYKWSQEDERLFISNIEGLKHKFNKTEFLKKCGRFRFISAHELQTLAAQQISRKLDQDNKVFLSREFLLDKYYSTTEFLSEQEMRFILKTSPLLSKCVDKQFIRTAIKNIQYEDINKLELKIAENIISRFDQIRKAVKESRKNYKQARNNQIKQRILHFEKKQEFEIIREIAREELNKHKPLLNKPTSSSRSKPLNLENKKKYLPLNVYHPPSGLFVKDCNQQCNDDLFNHYETGYIHKEKGGSKAIKHSMSMVQFYTGGPQTKTPPIPAPVIDTICRLIKAQFFEKSIKEALNNFQIPVVQVTNRTKHSTMKQASFYDLGRPKTPKMNQQCSEAQIKRKILESKQKAKGVIYVNKLLAFAAENSFSSVKALSAKFSADQVNTKDQRGNTALYYAAKNQNMEFMNYLLNLGADPSVVCQKQNTPLHHMFKTNNINLITRCLCAHKTPDLNALNFQNKTPLAYCTYDTLTKLYLQDGVLTVQNRKVEFNNNFLLSQEKLSRLSQAIGWENGRVNSRTKQT